MQTCEPLSAGNVRVREAAKLAQKKFRRETGRILIEGVRLVMDALDACVTTHEVFCTRHFLESDAGRAILARCGERVAAITPAAAEKLSDTRSPQGIFAVVEATTRDLERIAICPDALVLVADGIADPGNLGTMIRSAAAFGAGAVIASGSSCEVLNPKTIRATMGAAFRVPLVEDILLEQAIDWARRSGLQVLAAVARRGLPPWETDLRLGSAILVGSEADGLPQDAVHLADAPVTIPMPGGTESLNAAAAAAALLYEAARQRTNNH